MLLSLAKHFIRHLTKGKSYFKLLRVGLFHKLVSLQNLNCDMWFANRGGPRLDERVCYYDINSASSFANLQPVRQYTEHEVQFKWMLNFAVFLI